MLKHIQSFENNSNCSQLITLCEEFVNNIIAEKGQENCYEDGKFVGFSQAIDNNVEYGLARIKERTLLESVVKDILKDIYPDKNLDKAVSQADLLIFSEVEEHQDDHGERLFIVLRAPEGFQLNVIKEDSFMSEVLFPFQVYQFDENSPHYVDKYENLNINDFCIGINLPAID